MSKRYLILSDGTVYAGEAFGAEAESIGELVFNTGVVGYIETLTDPSYYGQTVMQTFPQIGNYGIIEADFEGECHVRGYVVREWCREPSNVRCQYDLDRFLKDEPLRSLKPVCGCEELARAQGALSQCEVHESIREYIVSLCEKIREDERALLGVSPRGMLALMRASQALALTQGRTFVTPDDIRRLAVPVLAHRIFVRGYGPQAATSRQIVQTALDTVPVPTESR